MTKRYASVYFSNILAAAIGIVLLVIYPESWLIGVIAGSVLVNTAWLIALGD